MNAILSFIGRATKLSTFAMAFLALVIQCHDINYMQAPLENRNGILTFSDAETFNKILDEVGKMSDPEFELWEKNQGFASLRTIHKKAIELEDSYLADYSRKHSDIGTITTRESLGYYPEVQAYINLGTLYTDSLGLLQSNTTTPSLAKLVNEQGVVKVGKKIIQYGRDYVKVIEDGNAGTVSQLKSYWSTNTDAGISVFPVKRVVVRNTSANAKLPNPDDSNGSTGGTTGAPNPSTPNRSCVRESNGYRLLVYLEHTYYTDVLGRYNHAYNIKLVSLCKSFWGGWDYCKSGLMGARGYSNAIVEASCIINGGIKTNSYPLAPINYDKQCDYTYECYLSIFNWNYDDWTNNPLKSNLCSPGYFSTQPDVRVLSESHYAYGKEGMNCTLPY